MTRRGEYAFPSRLHRRRARKNSDTERSRVARRCNPRHCRDSNADSIKYIAVRNAGDSGSSSVRENVSYIIVGIIARCLKYQYTNKSSLDIRDNLPPKYFRFRLIGVRSIGYVRSGRILLECPAHPSSLAGTPTPAVAFA